MSNQAKTPEELEEMSVSDLYELAKERGIKNYRKMKKSELIDEITDVERVLFRKVMRSVVSAPKESSATVPVSKLTPLPYGGSEPARDDSDEEGDVDNAPPPRPAAGPARDSFSSPGRRTFEPRPLPKPAPLPNPDDYDDDFGIPDGDFDTAEEDEPKRPMTRREAAPPMVRRDPSPPIVKREPLTPIVKREPPAAPVREERIYTEPVRSKAPEQFEEEEEIVEPSVSKDFGSREKSPERAPVYDEIDSEIAMDEPQRDTQRRGRPSKTDQRTAQVKRTAYPSSAGGADSEAHQGVLDIHPDGTYGFIRQKEFRFGEEDIYVSISQIKKFGLRSGDVVIGSIRPPRDQERYKSVVKIDKINGHFPDSYRIPTPFEKLVPIYPDQRIFLETDQFETSTRLLDLFSPIGRGQRCIILAKPKAGKTVLLKKIAASVARNHPEIELIALLIDERPEEVTDFERNIQGLVISSTFDEKPESHIQTAELAIEYAKRRVEQGKDVMILLDSLTRLARAYNLTCPPSGKTLTGGLDPNSLHKPKRFLGAARNIEGGGSLTILSSALIETGSRLDDIIYEEFKGTANSEIHLMRELADKRIFPAIDLLKSGTRHEELLYNPDEMDCLWQLRKMISEMDEAERMNRLISKLIKTKSNVELLLQVQKAVDSGGGY